MIARSILYYTKHVQRFSQTGYWNRSISSIPSWKVRRSSILGDTFWFFPYKYITRASVTPQTCVALQFPTHLRAQECSYSCRFQRSESSPFIRFAKATTFAPPLRPLGQTHLREDERPLNKQKMSSAIHKWKFIHNSKSRQMLRYSRFRPAMIASSLKRKGQQGNGNIFN